MFGLFVFVCVCVCVCLCLCVSCVCVCVCGSASADLDDDDPVCSGVNFLVAWKPCRLISADAAGELTGFPRVCCFGGILPELAKQG